MSKVSAKHVDEVKRLFSALETFSHFEILAPETRELVVDAMSILHPDELDSWRSENGGNSDRAPVDELIKFSSDPRQFVDNYVRTIYFCLFDERSRFSSADEIADFVKND